MVSAALFLAACASSGGGKTAAKDFHDTDMKATADSRRFTISVSMATPLRHQAIPLTSPYTLEVRGDSVFSYLPYFGHVYSYSPSDVVGLTFNARHTDYSARLKYNGAVRVTFDTRFAGESYRYAVELFPDRRATINVTPSNRSSISFDGELEEE